MDSPAEGGIGAGQPVYKAFIFPERHDDLDDPRSVSSFIHMDKVQNFIQNP